MWWIWLLPSFRSTCRGPLQGLDREKGVWVGKTSNIELLYSYSLLIVNRHGIYFHLRIFEICSQGKYCDHENVLLHTFLGPLSPNNQVLQIGLYLCIWSVKLRNLYKTETNVFVKINWPKVVINIMDFTHFFHQKWV